MVGSSSGKILTVSYGTFSCTLEGFDDPFSTMRGIAEYFRDLAADDRYFGAEPPTPDAEMLHRIAEREIQRRVEARVAGDNVVLRQLDTGLAEDEDDAPSASLIESDADAAPGDEDAIVAAAEFDTLEETHSRPEAPELEEEDEEPTLDAAERAGSIEDKLSRIRAVVERTRSRDISTSIKSAAVAEAVDADDEANEANLSPGFAGDIDATLISQAMAGPAGDDDDRVPDEDTPLIAEPIWDFDDGDDEAVLDNDFDAFAPENDELAGEDDVVESDGVEPGLTEDGDDTERGYGYGFGENMSGELDDETTATEDLVELSGEFAPDESATETKDASETEPGAEEDVSDSDPVLNADNAEPEVLDEPVSSITAEMGEETPTAHAEQADDEKATDAAIARIMSDEAEDASEAETGTDPEPVLDEEDAPEVALESAQGETETPESDDEASEDLLVSGEDSDRDDDLWDVDFDAEAREEAEAAEAGKDKVLDLSDEGGESEGEDDRPTSLAEARAQRSLSKSSQLRTPEEESPHIESQTENAFAEGEGTRRRSAIAHLKAAVAATRADKILSRVVGRDLTADPEQQKDYREDLSKVVKPHAKSEAIEAAEAPAADRQDAMPEDMEDDGAGISLDLEPIDDDGFDDQQSGGGSSRMKTRLLGPEDRVEAFIDAEVAAGTEEEPSPLMLVSELRVEEASETSKTEPRRVSRELTPEEAAASDEDGFVEFAERMGAQGLTDLMEAAAAYSAFVERQPHFSRPQIMRRVAKVDPSLEGSREAGLRSFGQLLRQGRIQKLQRGQFTVAENTRFRPEQRIAGE